MIRKLVLVTTGLLFANLAYGAASQACPRTMEGKMVCISGGMMQCGKEFDPKIQEFRYVWHGVNDAGQIFDVLSPMYKKVHGLTPAACTVSGHKVYGHKTDKNGMAGS